MEKLKGLGTRFLVFARGLRQKPSSIFLAILTIILGIPGFQAWSENHTILYVLFIICLILVFLWDIYGQGDLITDKDEEINRLKDKIQQRDTSHEMILESLGAIPEDFLELVFDELRFNSDERISLYTYRNKEFIIAARHARVRHLSTEGRPSYPEGEGYIGLAWREPDNNDCYYTLNLPDYNVNKEEYLSKVKQETKMSKAVIEKLTMHSRSYYAKIVREHNQPIGIIVLESRSSEFPSSIDDITSILNGMAGKHLAALIKVNENANGIGGNGNEQ
ncbi:hypothetical protein [Vagococcus humatus]|uniref:Uncharacterized protein n=1 Tax=Vagococcus humatus TaxID=1889241 RepID=A0A3S0GD39_9ENTE|nr:hypothetical protein [Vagococcus humatus]RST89091.1 hypothetical protein C7P63_07330 [Vagococcus humatus]